ncbi:MAG: hypothetical protein FWC40_01955 [Proteobacteria bacterium]|nr:hypothetical protein [Pseudomonadota bacterium]
MTAIDSDHALLATIRATTKTLQQILSSYKPLVKALERLDKASALSRQDYLAEAYAALQSADLGLLGCGEQKNAIAGALDHKLRALRLTAHHALLSGIEACLENPAHMRIISDNPLVLFIHPLTLEVQFEQSRAQWMYAHEPLQTTSLDPEEIMGTYEQILDAIRAMRIDSGQFFSCCRKAYDMALIKDGLAMGSRVDLIELMAPLAWLWPLDKRAKKSFAALPRHILAYQLQKLRADKMLQHQGWRMDLGSATGGTTRNKANVLYIPQGPSEGQYYLSICFRQV